MDQVENSSKSQQESVSVQLHEMQADNSALKVENERLKVRNVKNSLLNSKILNRKWNIKRNMKFFHFRHQSTQLKESSSKQMKS